MRELTPVMMQFSKDALEQVKRMARQRGLGEQELIRLAVDRFLADGTAAGGGVEGVDVFRVESGDQKGNYAVKWEKGEDEEETATELGEG